MQTIFFRLLAHDDKPAPLAWAVDRLRDGEAGPDVYIVDPTSFQQVPGSPFAYWVSEKVRRLFGSLPKFETEDRQVRVGLQTSDDFRFLRAWWEVMRGKVISGTKQTTPGDFRQQTFAGKPWVPFAKGGIISSYYSDLHLLVYWDADGDAIKDFVMTIPGTSHWSRRVASDSHYFRPGLTWPLRASRFSPSPLPAGCIFSVRGYSIFASPTELPALCGIGNSSWFDYLYKLMLGRFGFPEFVVGVLQELPFPRLTTGEINRVKHLAVDCSTMKMQLETCNETDHVFCLPSVLQVQGRTLAERASAWQARVATVSRQLDGNQREIDEIAIHVYGIDGEDRSAMEEVCGQETGMSEDVEAEDDGSEDGASPEVAGKPLAAALLSYATGCCIGLWDARFATGERRPPELPDPFEPLPACSPGMLQGDDGLPLRHTPERYPLRIDWDGILVDDPDHDDDIVRRVRDVFELIWKDRAETIEAEACSILGVTGLRDYVRKPGAGGFWDDHVKRYSKSRRKAPIYWLLQSSKKNYGLWLYYHRLDQDILFKARQNYADPKIRLEKTRLDSLRSQKSALGADAKGAKKIDKDIERQETLLGELKDFAEKLERAAKLNFGNAEKLNSDVTYEPDLNDGVVLNIAPLWELVPWKEAKNYWEELLDGKYEWSSMGKLLRRKGLVKC